MISPGEWADIRAAVDQVANRETDGVSKPWGTVERDDDGNINDIVIYLRGTHLNLEPEDEDIPDTVPGESPDPNWMNP